MNNDLDETLMELGPEYREMVVKLRRFGSYEPTANRPMPLINGSANRGASKTPWYAVAAAVTLAIAVSAVFLSTSTRTHNHSHPVHSTPYTVAYAGEGAIDEILRTQRLDGSWENDFLTRQNAAALRNVAAASVAYRKALRYLRSRGLSPISDAELQSRAQLAKNNYL